MAEGKTKRRKKVNIHTAEKTGDSNNSPVDLLEEITGKYAAVKKEDIDINEIYKHRENRNEREILVKPTVICENSPTIRFNFLKNPCESVTKIKIT